LDAAAVRAEPIDLDEKRTHDMYGHRIWPLGETGFGVSVSYGETPSTGACHAWLTVFHVINGFRLPLFTVSTAPQVMNTFDDVVAAVNREMQAMVASFKRPRGGD
jgi:hypothetical protein